jgi:hypothetical protein
VTHAAIRSQSFPNDLSRNNSALKRRNRGFRRAILVTADGIKVQVKYLANPTGTWRNGHSVIFPEGVDLYAIVIIEALEVTGIVIFSRATLAEVCQRLKKKHIDKLDFYQATFHRILADQERFSQLGVQCFTPILS